MKSTVESLSKLERKLSVQVPEPTVREAFLKAYRNLQKHATIKGFRKGKAPIDKLRTMYEKRVKEDVLQDLVQKHYVEALKEHSLEPISFPSIDFQEIEDGSDFTFTASFEVRPDIEIKKIKGLKVQKEIWTPSDDQVQKTLEQIQQSQVELKPMLEDRGLKNGDVAIINFRGFMGGEPLENGAADGHQLEIGSNSFIPGFEEGLLGLKVQQERQVSLKFPEAYHVESLAGRPVEFQVTLVDIKRKALPEINDELAKKVGSYETLEDLKSAVQEDIKKSEERRIKEDLKNRVLKALVESNPVDVPPSLLENQRQALVEDFKQRLSQQGFTDKDFDEYKEKWNQDFDETARFLIQSSFLIDRIAEQEGLTPNPEDIAAKFKEYSQQTGLDEAKIREFYGQENRSAQLVYQIKEQKVLDLLIRNAELEEVTSESLKVDETEGPSSQKI